MTFLLGTIVVDVDVVIVDVDVDDDDDDDAAVGVAVVVVGVLTAATVVGDADGSTDWYVILAIGNVV